MPRKVLPRIAAVSPGAAPLTLRVRWDKGEESVIDVSGVIGSYRVYAPLRQAPELFRQVRLGEFGTDVVWTDEIDMSADLLWRLAQEQAGATMTPDEFRHWRESKALTLDAAAQTLGISRRMVAYYEQGSRAIPRVVALATRGLDHQPRDANRAERVMKVAEVFRVPMPKPVLRTIPRDDRNLLLLASHAVNQLTILRKLLIFSLNFESDNEIENNLSAGQSQTILRILFGALAEAWELVRRPVNQKLIGGEYHDRIGTEGQHAYDNLKKHFGTSDLLHKVRNTLAFHYPTAEDLEAAFEFVPEDEDWAWYPSDTINNSFYLASDMVIVAGVMKATDENDITEAFRKVMGVVVPVSNEMVDFFLFLMRAIVGRYLGERVLRPQDGMRITNAPNLYSVVIPFFTERDDDKILNDRVAGVSLRG